MFSSCCHGDIGGDDEGLIRKEMLWHVFINITCCRMSSALNGLLMLIKTRLCHKEYVTAACWASINNSGLNASLDATHNFKLTILLEFE